MDITLPLTLEYMLPLEARHPVTNASRGHGMGADVNVDVIVEVWRTWRCQARNGQWMHRDGMDM